METAKTQPASIRELASTLFIYKGTILFLTVLFGGGAAVLSWMQPEMYEASVQILAQDQSAGLRGASNYASDVSARVKTVLTNLREVIYSRRVLQATLEQGGQLSIDTASSENGDSQMASIDDRVGRLAKVIRLEAPKGSDYGTTPIFFLRLRDKNPELALQLLHVLLDCFRRRYEELGAEQAEHLVEETTIQVDKSRELLKETERRLDRFVEELNGGLPELNSMGKGAGGDSELHKGLNTVNEKLVPAQAELKVLIAYFEQLQRTRSNRAMPGTIIRDYPGLDLAARQLATSNAEMDSVAARVTPDNPEFLAIQERIRLNHLTYRAEMDLAMRAIEREIAAKSQAVEFLQQQKDHYVWRMAELGNKYVEYEGLNEEIRQQRLLVQDAEKRRSDAAHAKLTAAQEVLFSTIDSPRASSKPVSPQRPLNIAIGTLLGLLTGIGLAFLARQYSQTVRSEIDLPEFGEDVVILSVPKVRTPLQKAV